MTSHLTNDRHLATAGIVVCGGQSKRMGRPKAWLPFGAEMLLPRVVRLLSQVVAPVVVAAAVGQDLPSLPTEIVIVRDEEYERGPLQGLAAGLKALQGRAESAYATSCDVPFLRRAFVHRLIELLGPNSICVPKIGGRFHPLAAVYRLEVLGTVQKLLAENRLRAGSLCDLVPTRIVTADELMEADPALLTLRNLNTLEDYQAALSEAESAELE